MLREEQKEPLVSRKTNVPTKLPLALMESSDITRHPVSDPLLESLEPPPFYCKPRYVISPQADTQTDITGKYASEKTADCKKET
jgi:hypothetical protein